MRVDEQSMRFYEHQLYQNRRVILHALERPIIAFEKDKVPQVFDEALQHTLAQNNNGLYVPLYEKPNFGNKAFVSMSDPQFFRIFCCCFPTYLTSQTFYSWTVQDPHEEPPHTKQP